MLLKRLPRTFWLLFLVGTIVRLAVAALAPGPGIGDPTHYYNLARNLADGRGFVIDYIWQYHNPPSDITHPEDYWMPLPAVWPALSFALFGEGLFAALLPSVLFGSVIPVLAYGIAKMADEADDVALMTMAGALFLPELVLNAARTDTTITYILWVGLSALCFYRGVRHKPPFLFAAGVFGGLAQLSRQDGILLAPAMLVTLGIYRWVGARPISPLWLSAVPIGWLLALGPWLARNIVLFGVPLTGGAGRTLFMTHFTDQFTYGRVLDLQHYLDWGIPNIIANWAFMAAANIKTLYTLLDVFLPVAALAGLWGMLWRRDRERLLLMTLPLVMIGALFIFYSFVTPFHTQGGSFKKSAMLALPFWAYSGAWAMARWVSPRRAAYVLIGIMVGLALLNSIELIRADFDLARRFEASTQTLARALEELGDANNDGEIVIMTQDPFMLNYHGYRALMIPSDPRDMILTAAARYRVDYILLPAARPALDPLYDDRESDPRLPVAADVNGFRLLRVLLPNTP